MTERAVGLTELIPNTGGTRVAIRNDSPTVDSSCHQVPLTGSPIGVSLPADEITTLGPFSLVDYGETIKITFSNINHLHIDTFESDFILTGEVEETITHTGIVTESIDLIGVAEPAITLDW